MNNAALGRIGQLIGMAIVQASGDRVELAMDVRPELWQPDEIIQGGVYCVVIEAAASLGGGLWLGSRGRVVGVNNNTDFLRAVHDGRLTAVATPIARQQLQQLWSVVLSDQSERTIARGQVRLQNLRN
ncbi:PaaI family thioesterase [Nocardia gamkensis]|uniref:PaaI family thioesterase n=1 Tax=Nocardia gamkensis TaxID=352869 RepID=UPI0033C1FC1F